MVETCTIACKSKSETLAGHLTAAAPLRQYHSSRCPEGNAFLQLDIVKTAARNAGMTILDLSVGTSDLPVPPEALEALKEAADDVITHGYCQRTATMPLLTASTAWYARRYGLELEPTTQALTLIGSQEGLAHALIASAEPGDGVLLASVCYPSYHGAIRVAGLTPLYMDLDEDFLPDFESVPEASWASARILLLNYPNNPTSATATDAFFQTAIALCHKHHLLLIHDNPYVDQSYELSCPSPLCLPGGLDVTLELFSFSKSFHLGGFRLGFALGNADAIAALEAVKAPTDFNQWRGIQRMGVTCLSLPRERLLKDAAIWKSRAVSMVQALSDCGWTGVRMPTAGMYVWAKLPLDGAYGADDDAYCKDLVTQTGVAVAPGRAFGPGGFGYVRIALTKPDHVLCQAAAKMAKLLGL